MILSVEKEISEISVQLHRFTVVQQENSVLEGLAERDIMILEILNRQEQMTAAQIAEVFPFVSETMISTAITRLRQERGLVSKNRDDQNQHTIVIGLTDKGKKAIEELYKQRAVKFQILFEKIRITEEEREVLLKILTRAKVFFNNR